MSALGLASSQARTVSTAMRAASSCGNPNTPVEMQQKAMDLQRRSAAIAIGMLMQLAGPLHAARKGPASSLSVQLWLSVMLSGALGHISVSPNELRGYLARVYC